MVKKENIKDIKEEVKVDEKLDQVKNDIKLKLDTKITFKDLGLSDKTLKILEKKGFKYPSEIQERSISIILENKHDLVGIAQTGTGKTGAFGLGMLERVGFDLSGKNPKAIILAPTRELALQVSSELKSFTGDNNVRILTVYGGTAINPQMKDLRRGVDVVVGTPGRVIDLINRRALDLSEVDFFVLDEADEMLKMGFIDDIEEILSSTPKSKRVLLFSATMPERIKTLTKKYMKKQKIVEVAKQSTKKEHIEQVYFKVRQSEKYDAMKSLIDFADFFYGIVFCQTKADVDNVTSKLRKDGYKADCIHGDIAQNKRERVLKKFRDGKIDILVATDVAARGIDVSDLTHVINYSLPKEDETYVHRIGRTGRAGKTGIAYTLITPKQEFVIRNLEKKTNNKIIKGQLPKFSDVEAKREEREGERIEMLMNNPKSSKFEDKARELIKKYGEEKVVSSLLFALNNSNNAGVDNDLDDYSNKRPSKSRRELSGKDTRLFIAKGRMDKFDKRKLLSFLENEADIDRLNAKDVKVCEKFSFISVPSRVAEKILDVFDSKNSRRPLVEVASEK